jgi:hypothetical protein
VNLGNHMSRRFIVVGLIVGASAAGAISVALGAGSSQPAAEPLPPKGAAGPMKGLESAEHSISPRVAQAIGEAGISLEQGSARTVRTEEGVTATVARDANGLVVLSLNRPNSDRVTTTRAPLEAAADGRLVLTVAGPETQGSTVVVAVVPDGVDTATVEDASGGRTRVAVSHNIVAGRANDPVAITWDVEGSRVRASLEQ